MTKTALQDACQTLLDKGANNIDFEYPGYLVITLGEYPGDLAEGVVGVTRTAHLGNVDGDYRADWVDGEGEPTGHAGFWLPATATVEELVEAIEGWMTSNSLSCTSRFILKQVNEAMEWAEGMGGPEDEDYVSLMEAIMFECRQRIVTFRSLNGGTASR